MRVYPLVVLVLVATSCAAMAAEWQYSVPMPRSRERRAYLWIPPDCVRVRGLIVGLQNMLEKPLLQDPGIRQAAAESGLGILWIAPGSEGDATPLGLKFSPVDEALQTLQQTLTDLARESGYVEIRFAPLLAVGHSAATPFVWGMGERLPSRVFALIPYKGWFPAHAPKDVPILHVSSEWAEWGANWGNTWQKSDLPSAARLRGEGADRLLGEFADIGAGHFAWTPDSARVIGLFIRKAAEYRLPAEAPLDRPVALKPIRPESGWLIDPTKLGTADGKPVPYRQWKGDPATAYWYFDEEMARAANDSMAERLRKKPQMVDFVVGGKPAPLEKNGFADVGAKWLDDGVTFRVAAELMDRSPTPNLYDGALLGHAPGPVLFRVGSGGLEQVGPDTFRVRIDRGGVERQGLPWEPWVLAYHPGDDQYRSTDRPAHVWISVRNKDGRSQAIRFPRIANQPLGTPSVKLQASADSGLPVQYFVISGPAEVQGDTLTLLPIPRRSRFPVRVLVAAYQWGRGGEPRVQSAGPVVQEFFIERSLFTHPGLLHTRADLERMRSQVASGAEPWRGGFEKLKSDRQSDSGWRVRGPFAMVCREAGHDLHNSDLAQDGNAAYQNALMWCLTGDPAHARKAVEILNAWSSTLKQITGHDKELAASLYGFKLVNAAELLRYTYDGWAPEEIRRFESLLRNVFYPVIRDFAPFANGNWDTGCIKTMMAIGVFLDDRPIFERAVEYFHNGSGNGRLTHYIINDAGQCQESGRDQQHTQLGIAHLAEACEIGWNQGLDMYGADDNRLLRGFEYTAKYNLGHDVPFVPHADTTGKYKASAISAEGRGRLRPIYEMVWNHYKNRRGIDAPYTREAAERLRPEGAAFQTDHPGFGTLLFSRPYAPSAGPAVTPPGRIAEGTEAGR